MTERRDGRLVKVVPPTAPWWSVLAFCLAATFLVVVGTYDRRLPGLKYDEAFDAVPILESLQGREPGCARTVALLGRSWPLMIHPHIGPTSACVAMLSFFLFGVSVVTFILLYILPADPVSQIAGRAAPAATR